MLVPSYTWSYSQVGALSKSVARAFVSASETSVWLIFGLANLLCQFRGNTGTDQSLRQLLKLGYFPKKWKHVIGKMILKPNKPKDNPASCRPISLLNCMEKLFEKTIANRIQ